MEEGRGGWGRHLMRGMTNAMIGMGEGIMAKGMEQEREEIDLIDMRVLEDLMTLGILEAM